MTIDKEMWLLSLCPLTRPSGLWWLPAMSAGRWMSSPFPACCRPGSGFMCRISVVLPILLGAACHHPCLAGGKRNSETFHHLPELFKPEKQDWPRALNIPKRWQYIKGASSIKSTRDWKRECIHVFLKQNMVWKYFQAFLSAIRRKYFESPRVSKQPLIKHLHKLPWLWSLGLVPQTLMENRLIFVKNVSQLDCRRQLSKGITRTLPSLGVGCAIGEGMGALPWTSGSPSGNTCCHAGGFPLLRPWFSVVFFSRKVSQSSAWRERATAPGSSRHSWAWPPGTAPVILGCCSPCLCPKSRHTPHRCWYGSLH